MGASETGERQAFDRRAASATALALGHWNGISTAFVKFEVAAPPTASRCQHWKDHVSPDIAATVPTGCAIAYGSRRVPFSPPDPLLKIPKRPMVPPRQIAPWLPPGNAA